MQVRHALRPQDTPPPAKPPGAAHLSLDALMAAVRPINREFARLHLPSASAAQLDENARYLGLLPAMHGAACAYNTVRAGAEAARHGGVALASSLHGRSKPQLPTQISAFMEGMNHVRTVSSTRLHALWQT